MTAPVTLTPEDEAVFALADRLFDGMLEIVTDASYEAEGFDGEYVLYGLWINLTRYLVAVGWRTEELLRDCAAHAAGQEAEGRA